MTKNRQWLIAGRPNGRALQESDFEWVTRDAAPLKEGEVRVRVMHLSCDPAQKGWMENIGGYTAPTNIGDVMRASGVGRGGRVEVDRIQTRRQGHRAARLAGSCGGCRARSRVCCR